MLRAVWFLLKLAALVALIAWFMQEPGTVTVSFRGTVVETSAGFAAAAFSVLLFVLAALHNLWRGFTGAPGLWRRYSSARRREIGYRDVTRGLVAVAAGDAGLAARYAARAKALVPDAPLSLLLGAQARLLAGDAPGARREFAALLQQGEAGFFGVKALLQNALAAKDYGGALEQARAAEKMQPGRAWIARTLFDLECRNREWARAGKALKLCLARGVFTAGEARAHGQALLLAEGDAAFRAGDLTRARRRAAEALAIDPAFTPAALRLAKFCRAEGRPRAALKGVLRAYTAAPHPELFAAWMALRPKDAASEKARTWAESLAWHKPDHRVSLRGLGHAALEARRYGEARELLGRAADYRLLARLEEEETGNAAKVRGFLDAAISAPPEPRWGCASCGQAEGEWAALCPRCGAFNTIVWSVPDSLPHALAPANESAAGEVLAAAPV